MNVLDMPVHFLGTQNSADPHLAACSPSGSLTVARVCRIGESEADHGDLHEWETTCMR